MFINFIRNIWLQQRQSLPWESFTRKNCFRVLESRRSLTKRYTSKWTPITSNTSIRLLTTKSSQKKKKKEHREVKKQSDTSADSTSNSSSLQVQPQQQVVSQTSTQSITQKKDKESEARYRLTPFEKMRSLVESRKSGILTTVNLFPPPGHMPMYGSLMPYVLLQRWPGCPIIALRTDEQHYQNVEKSPQCSLLIYALTPREISPSKVPILRLNMLCTLRPIEREDNVEMIFEKYKIVHPGSEQFLKDRQLFKYYLVDPNTVSLFFCGEESEIPQATKDEYINAPIDPIAPFARELIEMMNQKYRNELKLICEEYGDCRPEDVFMFDVDRLGFNLMGKLDENWVDFRVPWDVPITKVEDYRYELEECIQRLRKRNKQQK